MKALILALCLASIAGSQEPIPEWKKHLTEENRLALKNLKAIQVSIVGPREVKEMSSAWELRLRQSGLHVVTFEEVLAGIRAGHRPDRALLVLRCAKAREIVPSDNDKAMHVWAFVIDTGTVPRSGYPISGMTWRTVGSEPALTVGSENTGFTWQPNLETAKKWLDAAVTTFCNDYLAANPKATSISGLSGPQ